MADQDTAYLQRKIDEMFKMNVALIKNINALARWQRACWINLKGIKWN